MKLFTELTRALPIFRSHAYERTVVGLASGPVGSAIVRRSVKALEGVSALQRALIIADTNIGDALLLQPAVTALHHRFPACRVDYVFNHKMSHLVGADPAIGTSHAVLRGGSHSRRANLDRLREIFETTTYDLVINFCPFVTDRDLETSAAVVIQPLAFAIELLRSHRGGEIASMPYRVMVYIDDLAKRIPAVAPTRDSAPAYPGTRVFVSARWAERAARLLDEHGVGAGAKLVFVNPDTSNYSTFAGAPFNAEVVRRLLGSGRVDRVLLGRGFTFAGVETEILDALDEAERERIVVCPESLDLEGFAALVDRCAVYVGGDTGPLHIAAARTIDPEGTRSYRNRVAVIGVFKATDPRIYGYDTARDDMVDSSRSAVAVTVESRPPCKNLTCSMQRISASCPAIVCQDELSPEAVADAALDALDAHRADIELSPAVELSRR
jgi:3-deoxy-D-manno-octulosonic-acid transferase/heptosyltransferase-1